MDDPGSISYLVAIIILVAILVVEEVVYLVRSALNALTDSRAEELGEHPKKNVQKLIARKDDVFLAISLTSILMTTLFAMTATLAFAPPLMDWLHGLGVPAVWCTVLALIIKGRAEAPLRRHHPVLGHRPRHLHAAAARRGHLLRRLEPAHEALRPRTHEGGGLRHRGRDPLAGRDRR